MTAITLPISNLWHTLTALLTPQPLTTPAHTPQHHGIMHTLHQSQTIKHRKQNKPAPNTTPLNQQAQQFWQFIHNQISCGNLTWAIISDTPSTLIKNHLNHSTVALSHERVTALLAEQGLPYANISPIQFYMYVRAIAPQAKPQFIESQQCTAINAQGQGAPVRRIAYVLPLATLVSHTWGV